MSPHSAFDLLCKQFTGSEAVCPRLRPGAPVTRAGRDVVFPVMDDYHGSLTDFWSRGISARRRSRDALAPIAPGSLMRGSRLTTGRSGLRRRTRRGMDQGPWPTKSPSWWFEPVQSAAPGTPTRQILCAPAQNHQGHSQPLCIRRGRHAFGTYRLLARHAGRLGTPAELATNGKVIGGGCLGLLARRREQFMDAA